MSNGNLGNGSGPVDERTDMTRVPEQAPTPKKPITLRSLQRDLGQLFPGNVTHVGTVVRHREEDR